MRLIKPSFEIIEQKPGIDGLLQHIERCGRTCYKSEDKITEDSAEKFVNMLVNRGHTAMVEHGTVYLKYDIIEHGSMNLPNKYHFNKYSVVTVGNEPLHGYETPEYKEKFDGHTYAYITTNYRVLLQNDWLDDLKYQCEPTEHHVKRVTVKFVCDRGVSHEFVRHRVFSFAQESTRYCNYSKDKFGKECTFIIPSWLDIPEGEAYFHDGINFRVGANEGDIFGESVNPRAWARNNDWKEVDSFLHALEIAENQYFDLLNLGWIAQQARAVLPNSLKTELIMTGTIEQWEGFFKLRCAKDAHPQARELAVPLYEEFVKRGYITAQYLSRYYARTGKKMPSSVFTDINQALKQQYNYQIEFYKERNMERANRKSVNDNLRKYDHLAKKDGFIEVTEWTNGEGWDITINDRVIPLTRGELDAIDYLTKGLDYDND